MKKVCFFCNSPEEILYKQQYTLQDINILNDLGYELVVANKFSKIPLDCDFYFSWWASGSFICLIKALIANKPIVVVVGGNEVVSKRDSHYNFALGFKATPIYKKIATLLTLKYATKLISVSEYLVNDVVKLSKRKPTVIYNSVDTDKFAPNLSIKKEYVTTVINFEKLQFYNKRGFNFIDLIPMLLNDFPHLKFQIIGKSGNYLSTVRDKINRMNLEDTCELITDLDNDDMPSYLNRSLVYLQLSDSETFGVTIAEAMSCQIPVVVSKSDAIPEVVGSEGVYVNHDDLNDIYKKTFELLNYESEKDLILKGIQLRRRVVELFSYNKRREQIKNLISKY
jgi:glycosyltransferase involved in cell wall biosynthesis